MSNLPNQFPRTDALPVQSPLFWVAQKDRYLRQLLISDIEALTGRKLLVYFSNQYANAQIEHGDIPYFVELVSPHAGKPVDILIDTAGGFTDATDSIVQLLSNLTDDLRVIVANSCKSNGTLLCLTAKSIVMGASSELGPIEPLVGGIPCSILIKPEVAASNFVLHQSGVFALQQSVTLARNLLTNGMMKGQDSAKIDDTIEKLSTRNTYHSHGSTIDHKEATQLGLFVDYLKPENDIWKKIWLLYCMYDYDSRQSGLLKLFESSSVSTAIAAPKGP